MPAAVKLMKRLGLNPNSTRSNTERTSKPNRMAGTNLALVLLQKLPILPRHLIANVKHCRVNRTYVCASNYATCSTNNLSDTDLIKKLLKDKFPLAKSIDVEDISGGCGEMYEISVESTEFNGLTVVNQHRLVNEALKEPIKKMHGIIIHTAIPPEGEK